MEYPTIPDGPINLRWAVSSDLSNIYAIDIRSFAKPWSIDKLARFNRSLRHISMVAEQGSRVLGFMLYKVHDNRVVIIRLAVHPDYRRRGLGRWMLDRLHCRRYTQRRERLTCAVPDDNLPAHLWLRSCGFQAVGTCRRPDPECSIYRFEFRIPKLCPA
jgi:ribosomal-protein-alanine N-acetyltransferase